jgi:hypothetical protein
LPALAFCLRSLADRLEAADFYPSVVIKAVIARVAFDQPA